MIMGLIKSLFGKETTPSCCAVPASCGTGAGEHDVMKLDTSACAPEEKEEKAQGGCCGGGCH